ncbi:MAG TPA: hypothetical protein VGG45_16450 [Terracidiphilus sp.]|jgi:chromosome segregation ATPase
MSSAKVAAAIEQVGINLNSEVERVVGVVNKLKAENEELRDANATLRANRSELEWLRERLSDWDNISVNLAREAGRISQLQDLAARECAKVRARIDMLEQG